MVDKKNSFLAQAPAFRLLLPFVLGIIIERTISQWWLAWLLLFLSIVGYSVLHLWSSTPQRRLKSRSWFILPLSVATLSLGWICAHINEPKAIDINQLNGKTLLARVEEIRFTDFSMRLTVRILRNNANRETDASGIKLALSTRGCNYSLQPGDLVQFDANLSPTSNMGNPYEMDYAGFLLNNGIRYTQHLAVNQLSKCGSNHTLKTRFAQARRNIQTRVLSSDISPGIQRLLIAVLLGNDDLIDYDTRQEFSMAGIAHVLALSGLHVGFIALIIWWLLFPLDELMLRKVRLLISIIAIAAFAVFTGLSPSVVRATIMISFVFVSMLFYRGATSLNSLCVAALLILLFSPFSIYHVGFQLSFITVAALLLSSSWYQRLYTRNRVINYFVSLVFTSLVASISTIVLTAYYFHTISLISIVANLLVLPIFPLLMIIGSLFLLVTIAGFEILWLNRFLEILYDYILWVIKSLNSFSWSHIMGIEISWVGVIGYYAVLCCLAIYFYSRYRPILICGGAIVLLVLSHHIYTYLNMPREGLVVFNSFSMTPVVYFDHKIGYVWSLDDESIDAKRFQRYYNGFLAHYHIDSLVMVSQSDMLRLPSGQWIIPPNARLMNHSIIAIGKRKKGEHQQDTNPISVDDVIVTKRYRKSVQMICKQFDFKRIIISGAMYEDNLKALIAECDSLKIPYHNLKTQGAYVVGIPNLAGR